MTSSKLNSNSKFDKIFAKDNYINYGNVSPTLHNNYVNFDESPADIYERFDESSE